MKEIKTLSIALAVGGVWILIVTAFFLAVVKVEHWTLTGWIFTLLMAQTVATLAGFTILYSKIEAIKKDET